MTGSSVASEPAVRVRPRSDLGRTARRALTGIWFGYSGFFVLFGGITFDRRAIALWTMVTMVLLSWRGSRREAAVTFLSWLPFVAVIVGYELSWGIADQLGREVFVTPQLNVEKSLFGWAFGGQLPTTYLQAYLNTGHRPKIFDLIVSLVYVSHYFVPYAVAGVLWARHRTRWRPYAIAFGALGVISCAIWAMFPTAPPWMAGERGLMANTPRLALEGWKWLGLRTIVQLVGGGQRSVNQVAAIPSLHGAHCLLVVIFLWHLAPRFVRFLLPLYPLAMLFTLVYAGEHYAIDVLIGWGLVAMAVPASYAIDARLRNRKSGAPRRTPLVTAYAARNTSNQP